MKRNAWLYVHYPYIMQIVNIQKQAELTKDNRFDSSIV